MNIPSKNELRHLMVPQSGTCISIVLSTHRMGVEMQSDPLKLRNAIRTVEKRLHESDLCFTGELLKPIQALLDEKEFWQHEGDGLVIFAARHTCCACIAYLCMSQARSSLASISMSSRCFHC